MRRRMEAILAGKFPYLIAEEGMRSWAMPMRPSSGRAPPIASCGGFHLSGRSCPSRGVGKLLLTALIGQCTALGYRQMIAVIGGASPAHRSA